MRRIFFEYLVGLTIVFVVSIQAYAFIAYKLGTDYEYILRDHQAEAFQQLVEHIYQEKGVEEADRILTDYADKMRQKLRLVPFEEGPEVVKTALNGGQTNVFYYEETDLWLRLGNNNVLYELTDDEERILRKEIRAKNKLIWVFAIAGFAVSGLILVWRIKRRLNNLEQVTIAFSQGDLAKRASEKNSVKLGTLNKSFNVMADTICELLNSNKSLTNAVAHELRTPIFRIQWQAESISEFEMNDVQSKAVARILQDTEEMEEMVDELLYYARLERTDAKLITQALEVNSWIDGRCESWRKETQLELVLVPLKKSTLLNVDTKLFNRAVENIVRNAFKFADKKLVIELWSSGEELVIEFHDDGKGIESEHWPYLFDPFYSVNAARNKGKTGHGLGLAIVKQICVRHEAQVTVGESYLGGACFSLKFPIKDVTTKTE